MSKKDWETNGYHNGDPVYCPSMFMGDCPYCDQCNMCHIANPVENCDDFTFFFSSWDEWIANADDVAPEDEMEDNEE